MTMNTPKTHEQRTPAVASSDLLDREFETNIIKSFNKETGGYSLTFDNGWSFWMPDVGFAPEVGQTAKLYGRGTGYTVRGLVVNDRVVFYRTEAEQEELHRKEQAEREAKKRTDCDAKTDDYNRRVESLPPPFRERIEQAVEIANALKTPEEISRCAACSDCINDWRKHAAKLREMAARMSKTPSGAPPTFELTAEILSDCASELEAQHAPHELPGANNQDA